MERREGEGALYVGIMSGTSLDGIDAALISFDAARLRIVGSYSMPFDPVLREILLELATSSSIDIDVLARTHFLLASSYAFAVRALLRKLQCPASNVRAIGLHGQTIRHLPKPEPPRAGLASIGATLQLGSGPALAALTGIDVVSDFRAADVALGGQGAPLMPMFDVAMLKSDTEDRVIINIGGIANLTFVPKNSGTDPVAFDTGPGNMLIDLLTQKYFRISYDENGIIARSGTVNDDLLGILLKIPYFSALPPKSTGRELFGATILQLFVDRIKNESLSPEDAIATATELTARTIALGISLLPASGVRPEGYTLYVSGGGAYNVHLLSRISIATGCEVLTSDAIGIPPTLKECVAFAFFAKSFVENSVIHLPRTTGASKAVILGSLSKGYSVSI